MLAVKKNVTEMERVVEQAESDLGSLSTVKKVLNSVTLPSLFSLVIRVWFLPYHTEKHFLAKNDSVCYFACLFFVWSQFCRDFRYVC